MGSIPFEPSLVFGVVLFGWRRLERVDGPPLGRAAQVAVLFLYFQWLASLVLPWCLLVLALGWSVWWWIVPLALYAGLITRLCVGWQQVKAGEVVPRRRRLMHPATRRRSALVLAAAVPVLLDGVCAAALHQW